MERRAIDIALDMVGRPFLVREAQRSPLPQGVREVIWLAASSESELAAAGKARGRDPNAIRDAAIFFLQQALLYPGADNYRMLGLSPGAEAKEIRDHKRLLLKWLHPDRNPSSWEQLSFQRVAAAARELEQFPNDQSPFKNDIGIPRHSRHRSRTSRINTVRDRPVFANTLRSYLRRATVVAIVLVLGTSAWRLVFGELSPVTFGWVSW